MLRNGTLLHHGCEGTLLRIRAMGLQTLIGVGGEGGVKEKETSKKAQKQIKNKSKFKSKQNQR